MKKKTDNTVADRVDRYTDRQIQNNLVRVHPWVPLNRRDDLLAYAEKLRNEEAEKLHSEATAEVA